MSFKTVSMVSDTLYFFTAFYTYSATSGSLATVSADVKASYFGYNIKRMGYILFCRRRKKFGGTFTSNWYRVDIIVLQTVK